jgi:hypothetical protein
VGGREGGLVTGAPQRGVLQPGISGHCKDTGLGFRSQGLDAGSASLLMSLPLCLHFPSWEMG